MPHSPTERTSPIHSHLSPELQQRIAQATEHLSLAERELEVALGELAHSERSNKQIISQSLQVAFTKLATAKRDLQAILNNAG